MNKTVIIAAVALLILLGGGAFVLSQKSTTSTPSASPTTQDAQVTAETSQQTGTLGSLLSAGTNQECTFSSDTMTAGTVTISGDKMRGSFTANNQTSDMIKDGEWVYIWSSAMPQGIKTKFDLSAAASADVNAQKYVDTNQQVNYDCKPWSVDASKFELPEGVTFTDISASVNQMQNVQIEDSSGMRAEQCKSCNNLSGQAKDYCEQTFCATP